jgi:NAD(P)-dependent dehydrogenase (short-subunit alcohol dehydrogenase family)
MKYELPLMKRTGGGAIVNTASVAALTGPGGMSAYAASKHGVHGLTRVAAMENAAHNIRVNTLAPGFTETPMVVANSAQNPAFAATRTAIPAKREASPANSRPRPCGWLRARRVTSSVTCSSSTAE